MPVMFWIWLGVTVAAVIIELSTQDLVSIWFSAGGLIAMLMSISPKVPWYASAPVFLVISFVLLISLRKITKKFLHKKSEGKTNLDLIVGQKTHIVTAGSFDTLATVVLNGLTWNVRTESRDPLIPGDMVEVLKIQGNTLIIEKIKSAEDADSDIK
ncbi:MAG: NfeD family protein [Clostridiales bacterium]|jgi:membrane protein implicated in regulation of membrane protease activity|nr:NfeD family protein [Clostridiales bacterium]